VLIVHKNTVGGEIWCSFLSTHAFLLGDGQTYATRGVPYFRVSRIFMSRNFSVPHWSWSAVGDNSVSSYRLCSLLAHFSTPALLSCTKCNSPLINGRYLYLNLSVARVCCKSVRHWLTAAP